MRKIVRWFSDERLKCDIKFIGFSPSGLRKYSFRYKKAALAALQEAGELQEAGDGPCNAIVDLNATATSGDCDGPRFEGVIAQDLIAAESESVAWITTPDKDLYKPHSVPISAWRSVTTCTNGYLAVDYSALDVKCMQLRKV